jgi:hypothetical protein
MIRQILGVIAQFEKTVIVEKLRAARERKRASGQRCEGVKPYGHFPGEEAGLKLIRELAGTMSTRAIAAELNNKQFPSRHGRTWCHSVVAKILKGSNQCAGSNQQNTIA